MQILKKYTGDFTGFDWLNFTLLSHSNAFKFEIYFKDEVYGNLIDTQDLISKMIACFYSLFGELLPEMLVQDFFPHGQWGDFCLDTWNFKEDTYDYSIANKEEPTASYLAMLQDSGIEPTYVGFCQCLDWDKFLRVMLQCVMWHVAPYSMIFYVPSEKFIFYFHHSGSLGLYYVDLNKQIKAIIQQAKEDGMEIKNTNDGRVITLINNSN